MSSLYLAPFCHIAKMLQTSRQTSLCHMPTFALVKGGHKVSYKNSINEICAVSQCGSFHAFDIVYPPSIKESPEYNYICQGKLLLDKLIHAASGVADQLIEPNTTATIFIIIPSLPGAETDTDALSLSSLFSESLSDCEPEHISTGTRSSPSPG